MLLKKLSITVILLSVIVCLANGEDRDVRSYGLTFKSHNINQDERTGVDFTHEGTLGTKREFSVEFDVRHIVEQSTYGHVFRLIADDTVSFDMVTNQNGKKINFVYGTIDNIYAKLEFNISQNTSLNWMTVKLEFKEDRIICSVGDLTQKIDRGFKYRKIKLLFGSNGNTLFSTTDVPPITIRNLCVYDQDRRKTREWIMSKHADRVVYDQIEHAEAWVANGIWEIDKYLKWEKETFINIPAKNPQIAYDVPSGRIFIAYDNVICIYDIAKKTTERIIVESGKPFNEVGSQMVYFAKTNELISYSLVFRQFIIYNFETNTWTGLFDAQIDIFNHHNKYINRSGDKMFFFGGYGEFRYNSLLQRYDMITGKWSTTDLSKKIPTRYLSAAGSSDDDKLLVMGGYGSQTGRQEESPVNHYDLYEIDLESSDCRKILDFDKNSREHYTFANSLIVDKKGNKIYSLVYNNKRYHSYISLFGLDLNSKQAHIWSDSIPYNFLDVRSFCDIFLCEKSDALYAVVSEPVDDEMSTMSLYSMAYAPLPESDVLQLPENRRARNVILFCLLLSLMLLAVVYSSLKLLKRKKRAIRVLPVQKPQIATEPTLHADEDSDRIALPPAEKSYIRLLGSFLVLDKDGVNITGQFSPIIRHLFVYLLLKTEKDGKGVSSQFLDKTLWFDMEYKNALNNRRVNMRKLRLILDRIGDVSVQSENGYWYIQWDDKVYCDYHHITMLLNQIRDKDNCGRDTISEIITIASSGTLLPDSNAEWIDEFKSEFSWRLTDTLLQAIELDDIKNDLKFQIKIADVILQYDCIDENAIGIKCRALYSQGQKGLSKACFDKFRADYRSMLDSDPELDYSKIINL